MGEGVRDGLFDAQMRKRVWRCTVRFGRPTVA